jgi:hypothetical protein
MDSTQSTHWSLGRILDNLLGSWELKRTLHNISNLATIGTMQGIARFIPNGETQVISKEEGVLILENGHSLFGRCSYYFQERGTKITIFFDPQYTHLFHLLSLQGNPNICISAKNTHVCQLDRYDSRYAFYSNGNFAITHTVNGPRKSYISHTLYHRMSLKNPT